MIPEETRQHCQDLIAQARAVLFDAELALAQGSTAEAEKSVELAIRLAGKAAHHLETVKGHD